MAWSRGALAATILWSLWQTSWADILPSVRSRADVRAFPRGPEVPDDAALEASGAIVGTVRHVRLNVFDTTIPAEDTALFRVANRIHIVSRESTLGAQLLFRSGERYEGRLLEESERVLRSKAYLADARIRPVSYRDGRVDIEVVTQDTWTLRPEVHFARTGGENTSGFGIEEHNLFGTGAQLGLAFKSGVERDSNVLVYKDANVGGSRWRIDADYAKNSDGWAKRFALDRPFYALDTRWASGIGLRDERRIDSVYEGGQVIHQFATHERIGTVYVGHGLRRRFARPARRLGDALDHRRQHRPAVGDGPSRCAAWKSAPEGSRAGLSVGRRRMGRGRLSRIAEPGPDRSHRGRRPRMAKLVEARTLDDCARLGPQCRRVRGQGGEGLRARPFARRCW